MDWGFQGIFPNILQYYVTGIQGNSGIPVVPTLPH